MIPTLKIKKNRLILPHTKVRGLFVGFLGCSEIQHLEGCGFNNISDINKLQQRVGNTEIKNFCLLNFQENFGGNSRWE
ncbi:MAG: hypothetical protein Q7R52_05280 [archaeon]|nr:hypothetical protein [archaeon]